MDENYIRTFSGKICRKLLKYVFWEKFVGVRIFSKIPYFYGKIRKCGIAD